MMLLRSHRLNPSRSTIDPAFADLNSTCGCCSPANNITVTGSRAATNTKANIVSSGHSERSAIRLSLLDRLLDDAPRTSQEVPPDDTEKLRIVQRSVRRDLECLLNTRYRCVSWPPELNQIDNSLVNYGMPDFTAASLNAADDSDILINAVKQAIDFFEPRLVGVKVTAVPNDHYFDRTFRFRIEGTLVVEDGRHRVKFDSAMESATGKFEIK